MTEEQRRQDVLRMIREYTDEATTSPQTARATLIKEGIYTAQGQLAVQYGGKPKGK